MRSLDDFEKRYFPRAYKKKVEEEASPEERARLWVEETMDKFRKVLRISARGVKL